MQWYLVENGNRIGPVSDSEFGSFVASGRVRAETLVWNETLSGWQRYGDLSGTSVAAPGAPTGAAAPGAPPAAAPCSQCGKMFPREDLLSYEGQSVCATCKPLFLQRVKEGVAPAGRLNYAGFWIRFGASFLDGMIQTLVGFVVGFLLGLLRVASSASPRVGAMDAAGCLTNVILLLFGIAYEVFFIGAYGATPGKMALRLKVVTPEGGKVSYATAFGRYFGKALSAIILLIGYIMAAFDDEKRALHDRICGTRVIRVT